jgi:hypothetical protein
LPAQTVHAVFMAALDGMFATVMIADEYLSWNLSSKGNV